MRFAFVLYPVGFVLASITPKLWLLLVPTFILGVANGLNIPNIFSLLNEYAPSENRGVFLSINGMTLRLGQILGLTLCQPSPPLSA